MRYGDTDSIFATKLVFTQSDPKDRVSELFVEAQKLKTLINGSLAQTYSPVLKMEFEEIIFPSKIVAKKKYYGYKHYDFFNPDADLFFRGGLLAQKKTLKFIEEIARDFLRALFDLTNSQTAEQLLSRAIANVVNVHVGDIELFTVIEKFDAQASNIFQRNLQLCWLVRGFID